MTVTQNYEHTRRWGRVNAIVIWKNAIAMKKNRDATTKNAIAMKKN